MTAPARANPPVARKERSCRRALSRSLLKLMPAAAVAPWCRILATGRDLRASIHVDDAAVTGLTRGRRRAPGCVNRGADIAFNALDDAKAPSGDEFTDSA